MSATARCEDCEKGASLKLLDRDGVLSDLSGEPGIWCHAHEEFYWACPARANYDHAVRARILKEHTSNNTMVFGVRELVEGLNMALKSLLDAQDTMARRWTGPGYENLKDQVAKVVDRLVELEPQNAAICAIEKKGHEHE